MTNFTKIICDCGNFYFVRYSPNHEMFDWRLVFSVCPNCGVPRTPGLFNEYKNNWHCDACHVPEPFATRKKDSHGKKYGTTCVACYNFEHRTFLLAMSNSAESKK